MSRSPRTASRPANVSAAEPRPGLVRGNGLGAPRPLAATSRTVAARRPATGRRDVPSSSPDVPRDNASRAFRFGRPADNGAVKSSKCFTKVKYQNGAISNGHLKPWKKNLYSNDGYPDNYTDKSFLEELKKNLHVRKLTHLEAILGASLITQRLCIVVIFALSFYALNCNLISPLLLLMSSTIFCFIIYLLVYENFNTIPFRLMKSMCAFVVSGYILSPVLKTLTETISTDTIYATTTFMMCVHLVFFDYGVSAVIVSTSLSLNAALFASICLCSRLQTAFHVFVFITISVQCFAVSPILLSPIKSSISMLLSFVAVTLVLCMRVSLLMSALFVCTVVFINLVCPYYFVKWYLFKDNIYGPWDEAIVQDIKIKNFHED